MENFLTNKLLITFINSHNKRMSDVKVSLGGHSARIG